MTIRNSVLERNIESLYHFTTIENLISIMERGFIYSRNKIDELKRTNDGCFTADYVDHMDNLRLDGLRDFINLSLSRPNWYLLNQYIGREDLKFFNWCIIELRTDSLMKPTTLFSVCNAASNAAKNYGVTSGKDAFDKLFIPEVITPHKTYLRNGLSDKYTTDIQAEVLVKDKLPIREIKHIFLRSHAHISQFKAAFNMLDLDNSLFSVNSELFERPILK